jgi:lysophospholipase L1-like esterase
MFGFLIFLIIIIVLAYAGAQGYRMYRSNRTSERLIQEAEALENHPENPDRRILILGDSIWAGVGASDPADSMAGRLIADAPQALVVNKAESGAKITDGRRQLQEAGDEFGKPFDQIIIQLGANDILQISSMSSAESGLQKLLKEELENRTDMKAEDLDG